MSDFTKSDLYIKFKWRIVISNGFEHEILKMVKWDGNNRNNNSTKNIIYSNVNVISWWCIVSSTKSVKSSSLEIEVLGHERNTTTKDWFISIQGLIYFTFSNQPNIIRFGFSNQNCMWKWFKWFFWIEFLQTIPPTTIISDLSMYWTSFIIIFAISKWRGNVHSWILVGK